MRRMLFVLTSLGLLGPALGCHCMHGVCDCDYTPWGTPMVPYTAGTGLGGPAGPGAAGVAPFAVGANPTYAPALAVPGNSRPEPIRVMPNADAKPSGDTKTGDSTDK